MSRCRSASSTRKARKGLKRGGVLNSVRHELELVCDAAEIPEEIQISLAGLDIGDSIHISHVKLPAGSESAITDRDFTIATIVAPTVYKATEGEEGAEAPEAGDVPLVGEARRRRRRRDERRVRPCRCSPGSAPCSAHAGPRCRASPLAAPEAEDMGDFAPVQIWVGLGNPGASYAMQRHNVGFMAVDAIAETHGFDPPKKAFSGWTQQGRIGGQRILLLKPATFMNDSGRSVRAAMDFSRRRSATSPSSTTSSISPRSRSR